MGLSGPFIAAFFSLSIFFSLLLQFSYFLSDKNGKKVTQTVAFVRISVSVEILMNMNY